ncbi:MAG: aminotransferase class I/II-fold pyridoxal phosphate-dependent enzyme, partial [Micrococcales bacterium]|nr:aminotransferase class I/II-fold pyridoxal phosphate-dependent enzyme [Micrococcales bacterium]
FCLHPLEVPGDADLVVVGNPTNPTSRLHPARALRAIRDAGPADRMLLVDEAFMDLVPDQPQSLLAEAATGGAQTRSGSGRLCVVRSLTKAFGLAGVRAGYVVGDPDFIARLRELQPPWSVNTLALAATAAVSGSRGCAHLDFYSAGLVSQRRHLVTALSRAGLAVVPEPAGPFVLARHRNAWQLRESLRRRGISVRRGDTFPGLGSQWLRFAVRNSDTTDHVTAEIMAVCQELERSADRRPPARRSEAAATASPGATTRPPMTPEDSR